MLTVIAVLALLGALISGYFAVAVLDADQFADRASAALETEAVGTEIGDRVSEQLIEASPNLISVRPVLREVIAGIARSKAFRDLFRLAARDVHRSLFDEDANTVTLTLADIGTTARGALEAFAPRLAKQIPATADVDVLEEKLPQVVAAGVALADGFRVLPFVLLVVGLLAGAGGIWAAPDRRRLMAVLGVGLMISGVLAFVGMRALNVVVLNTSDPGNTRDAVNAIWGAYFGDLQKALLLFAAAGAVITAAASSLLRPVDIGAPLRRGWEVVAAVPESTRLRVLRGVLMLVVGILIVVENRFFLELIAVLIGLYVAYAGASELMRLTIPHTSQDETEAKRGRAALITAGVAAVAIVVAGAVFVQAGGASENPATIETSGCNGSEALCDATLDQVAFPSTHNAMSAATNRDWLFAEQQAGFPDQLRDGIRGLLIDAHYGVETEDGTIKTDLSDLTGPERKVYEQEIGPQALDAALRIRDRLVDSSVVGERKVYLCHRFCELGAIPIDQAFREYRDFLAANPDEILVIVIEDYVAPEDIESAVESSGLIDYVYKGPLGPPWPTLGEMAESNGRVLMMAENDAGGGSIPWYHEAYEGPVQETPFTFKEPPLLTKPKNLDDSCEPNRGTKNATLFLLNHWIETAPAPRPTNAQKVNTREALSRRIRRCEKLRGLPVGLIAVDFYRTGGLFEVARKLNAQRTR